MIQKKIQRKFLPGLGSARIGVLFTAALCTPVIAGDGDAIHPFVGLGYSYEDNLLRLPDEHPGFGGQRSDVLRQAIAGILFDRTYSRQHIFVQGKVTKVNFDHFKQLDYDGKDLLGRWRWEAGRQFSGTLEASYLETLSSFTDFHNGERNLREQRHMLADVAWRMHPSWRLRGAVSEDEFSYELPSLFFNNRKEKRAEAGIDFVSRSGNYAGLVLRRLDGEYPNKRFIGSTLVDEDFQQDEVKARVYWRASGATTLDLLAGWAKRKHAMLGERDASGVNGRATVVYTPRGKTRFTAAVWRDFAPIENTVIASSLNKGASLNVDYLATAKTRLNASVRKEKRNYSARISTPAAVELSDSLRYASLGATYAATRNIQVSVNGFRESRKGGQALGLHSYRAKGASFSVNVQF